MPPAEQAVLARSLTHSNLARLRVIALVVLAAMPAIALVDLSVIRAADSPRLWGFWLSLVGLRAGLFGAAVAFLLVVGRLPPPEEVGRRHRLAETAFVQVCLLSAALVAGVGGAVRPGIGAYLLSIFAASAFLQLDAPRSLATYCPAWIVFVATAWLSQSDWTLIASDVVNATLLTMLALAASRVIYVSRVRELLNQRLVEAQRARLAQSNAALHRLSILDPLTGIANRRALEGALARPRRPGRAGALLLLDLDHFKVVNDTLGHAAGDQALLAVARLLREKLRAADFLARFGGDEFAALLEDVTLDEALVIAERMRAAIEEFRFVRDGHSFSLGLSIGLAPIDGPTDPDVVLSRADRALYRAKEHGRNRVKLYSPEQDDLAQFSDASHWASRLRDALRDDLLVLHYQPVVRLHDRTVDHYEALVRLPDGKGGLIYPGAFIPAAERFGVMPHLSRWVVRKACRALRARPGVRVFVNLSGRCFADETLPDFIAAALAETHVEPDRLGFEITETAIVQDFPSAGRWMAKLRALGCRFALDDFGAGLSSFAYLRELPVDELKIDGNLIRSIPDNPSRRALVRAVQTLAEALGKETTAEWVEDEATAEELEGIGVGYGQGYHFGEPAPWPPADSPGIGGDPLVQLSAARG